MHAVASLVHAFYNENKEEPNITIPLLLSYESTRYPVYIVPGIYFQCPCAAPFRNTSNGFIAKRVVHGARAAPLLYYMVYVILTMTLICIY